MNKNKKITRRKRINGNRSARNRLRYTPLISQKPQTWGPGKTRVYCNSNFDFSENTTEIVTVNLGNLILGKPEFIAYRLIFKYMKIIYIKFVFYPHNFTNVTGNLFFQLCYGSSPDTTNLQEDDQTKLVPAFQPDFRTYTFRPPNTIMTTFQGSSFNFKNYVLTQSGINFPLNLVYQKVGLGTQVYPANIQILIEFRGSNITTVSSSKLLKLKEEEEEIKEEIEEDEKQKEIKELENKINKLKIGK